MWPKPGAAHSFARAMKNFGHGRIVVATTVFAIGASWVLQRATTDFTLDPAQSPEYRAATTSRLNYLKCNPIRGNDYS